MVSFFIFCNSFLYVDVASNANSIISGFSHHVINHYHGRELFRGSVRGRREGFYAALTAESKAECDNQRQVRQAEAPRKDGEK
jgi:hypothetical protein